MLIYSEAHRTGAKSGWFGQQSSRNDNIYYYSKGKKNSIHFAITTPFLSRHNPASVNRASVIWSRNCKVKKSTSRVARDGTESHDPFVLQCLSCVKQKSPWLWWKRRGYSGDSVLQINELTPSSLSSCSEQKSAEWKAKSDLQSIFIKSHILSLQFYKQYFYELKITSC